MTSRSNGTVTFLFTDIENSTRLAREYPDSWEVARARPDAILHAAIENNSGYIFQIIGDAFCAAFHKAKEALDRFMTRLWGLSGPDSLAPTTFEEVITFVTHAGIPDFRIGFPGLFCKLARVRLNFHGWDYKLPAFENLK